MTLVTGTKLGPYEILDPIGAGGMGEVYRARDAKLGRDVAIKVLPAEFSQDKERLDRFEREARLLAQLNHTNVATLYGLEAFSDQQCLVMELVEGETLAERIAQGPIAVDDALSLFLQIAEGLEAAHAKGIVHRDLKPANIKIRPDGQLKILDFGLAKVLAPENVSAETSQSPTLTKGTALGAIMGTASYMSPEQAKGKPVDARTDVWAFGCVVFESLSGERAFPGDDVSEILASVLRDEPRWEALPGASSRRLIELIRRCLRKEMRRRFQHIGDARVDLEDIASHPEPESVRSSNPTPWMTVGLVAALALAAWGWLRPRAVDRGGDVTRSSIELEFPLALDNDRPVVAIAADGSRVAAIVDADGKTQIYVRELSELEGRLIPRTEGAVEVFFSPDGQSVGFVGADNNLKTISFRGGAPVNWGLASPVTRGGTWVRDDQIVMNRSVNSGLASFSNSGWSWLTAALQPEGSHRWPHGIPGNQNAVLFTMSSGASYDEAKIGALALDSGDTRVVFDGGTSARSTLSGHLVFGRGGALMAAPLDTDRLEVTGTSVSVVENVMNVTTGAVHYAISETGTLVYVEGPRWAPTSTVAWIDAGGIAEFVLEEQTTIYDVALSPDGERAAMTVPQIANTEIWTYDLTRGTQTRLTFDPGEDLNPIWSPDGQWIAFASEMNGEPPQLHRMRADGSGQPEQLLSLDEMGLANVATSWSPDGKYLVGGGNGDIWLLSLDEPGRSTPLVQTEYQEHGASFSPDGRWLAYHSDESGRPEVYVQPFRGPEGKRAVSTDGGNWPKWSASGDRIFYRNGDRMMEVSVGSGLELSRPKELFRGKYGRGIGHSNYDVSKDGRFLMIAVDAPPQQSRLVLITNWFQELERLVPAEN